eukprot:749303-Hanusia_phi.AAC.3
MYPLDPNRTAEPVKDEQAIEKFWSYQGQMESEDDENEKCPWKPDVPPEFRKEFEQREAKSTLFPSLPQTHFSLHRFYLFDSPFSCFLILLCLSHLSAEACAKGTTSILSRPLEGLLVADQPSAVTRGGNEFLARIRLCRGMSG